MAILAGRGPLVAGLIMAAPVLLIGAPLVVADVYVRKTEPTVAECRAVLAKAAQRPTVLAAPVRLASRGNASSAPPKQSVLSIFTPAQVSASLAPRPKPMSHAPMTAAIVGMPKLAPVAAPVRTAKAAPPPAPVPSRVAVAPARPVRVAALGRGAPLPRAAAAPVMPLSCAGMNAQGLACGSAAAQKPAIQAQLSYSRLNTRCAGLMSAYGRGGLEGAMIYAMTASQQSARNAGASPDTEEAQVKRALQKALALTGSAPRDVLSALTDLETVYGGCPGYDTARNALRSTASLIQGELNIDQPTATPGFGAALANPGLPATGGLGTASYSSIIVH